VPVAGRILARGAGGFSAISTSCREVSEVVRSQRCSGRAETLHHPCDDGDRAWKTFRRCNLRAIRSTAAPHDRAPHAPKHLRGGQACVSTASRRTGRRRLSVDGSNLERHRGGAGKLDAASISHFRLPECRTRSQHGVPGSGAEPAGRRASVLDDRADRPFARSALAKLCGTEEALVVAEAVTSAVVRGDTWVSMAARKR